MHDMTPDVISLAETSARAGLPKSLIADRLGIPRSIFYEWLAKGDDGIEPFVRFSVAFRRAAAEWAAERWAEACTDDKGSGGSRWGLEKRYPEDFGNRTQVSVEHSGTIGVQVVSFRDVPMEEIMALASGRPRPVIVDAEAVAVPDVPRETLAIETTKARV